MHQRTRFISFLLVVSILLSTLYLPIVAEDTAVPEAVSPAISSAPETVANAPAELLQGIPVDLESEAILKHVDQDAFRTANHTLRLPKEESLNTYVYMNDNGTKTVYFMDENVKYIDKEGNVQEKDISLKETKNGFTTVKNDVSVFIPTNAANGIQVSHSIGNVKLIPQNSLLVVAGRQDGDSVLYPNYFGKGISLRYTPLLSGVKEDIILASYTGTHSFQFALETNGLFVYEDVSGYYVAASADAEERYALGEIIVYDAVGRPSMGSMTVKTVTAGRRYVLTVSADPAFLTDADTVYPVTIDPTITVNGQTDASLIWDVPIFSGYPTWTCGAYQYLTLGNAGGNYGTGRAVVKLPGLYQSSIYQSLTMDRIIDVSFYCSDGSGNASQYVSLYANINTTWTENNASWNSVGIYESSFDYGTQVSHGMWTRFDITGLVQQWKFGLYFAEAGFQLVNADEVAREKHKAIHATEYATASYRPYVTMSYNPTLTISNTCISVVEGGTQTLTATTNPTGLTLNWSSSNETVATVNNNGVVSGLKAGTTVVTVTAIDAAGGIHTASCTVYVYIQNGVYYIQNMGSGMYLHTKDGAILPDAEVYQYNKYADTVFQNTKLRQQWRIHYLGNGAYSIRPMHRIIMGLNVKMGGTAIVLGEIGETDTYEHVDSLMLDWTIEWCSSGYVFKYCGSNRYALGVEVVVNASEEPVVGLVYDATSISQRWTLTRMISPPSGVILYNGDTQQPVYSQDKYYMAKDDEYTTFDHNLRIAVYSDDILSQTLTWQTSNANIVSINSSDGKMVAKSAGIATITAGKTINGTYYSTNFSVEVMPLPKGTYFLKNKQTGYYADILSQTMTNENTIHQWQFHGGDTQKWYFGMDNTGYYTIRSENSTTSYYLGVVSDSSELNADVVLRSGTVTNGMKWKISTTDSGAYRLTPKTGELSDYALATTSSTATNGAKLIQGAYVYNNSYCDEWELISTKIMYYVHYYDSTLTLDNDTISRFNTATEFSSYVFGNLIDYEYLMNSGATQYTEAIADTCTHASNVPCSDICGTRCSTQHHKNCYQISNQLYNDNCEVNHIYVLWTNREPNTYCHEEETMHTTVSWLAVVYGHRPVIQFLQIYSFDKEAYMGINLVHETVHTLGFGDVYDNVGHDVDDAYVCVMEKYDYRYASEFYNDIITEKKSAFCDSCRQMLQLGI